MLLGLALALVSGTVANTGVYLQKAALDARMPEESVLAAFRRPAWLCGLLMLQLGWFAQIGALKLAPLYLVQPLVASGVVALVVLAHRRLDEPVDARLVASVGAVVLGAGLLAASAAGVAPAGSAASADVSSFVALGTAAVLLGWSSRFFGNRRPLAWALSAGILYGCAVALTKPVAGQLQAFDLTSLLRVATNKEIYLVGVLSLTGFVFNQLALAEGRASVVAPSVLATMTVLPVVLGVVVFGERLPPFPARLGMWVGTAVCLGGVVLLSHKSEAGSRLAAASECDADGTTSGGTAARALPPTTATEVPGRSSTAGPN